MLCVCVLVYSHQSDVCLHSERGKAFGVWSLVPQVRSGVFLLVFTGCVCVCESVCNIAGLVSQVDAGSGTPQVRVTLVVRNPEEGRDLSQLCIRDSVSDVILQQTNGSVQERGYQTFSKDTLPGTQTHTYTPTHTHRLYNTYSLFSLCVCVCVCSWLSV